MHKGPYLNTEYIGFYLDSKSPVINSKKIREAINIGFNRELMIEYLRKHKRIVLIILIIAFIELSGYGILSSLSRLLNAL